MRLAPIIRHSLPALAAAIVLLCMTTALAEPIPSSKSETNARHHHGKEQKHFGEVSMHLFEEKETPRQEGPPVDQSTNDCGTPPGVPEPATIGLAIALGIGFGVRTLRKRRPRGLTGPSTIEIQPDLPRLCSPRYGR